MSNSRQKKQIPHYDANVVTTHSNNDRNSQVLREFNTFRTIQDPNENK